MFSFKNIMLRNSWLVLLLCLMILNIKQKCVNCEAFSSTANLLQLVESEQLLSKNLQVYIEEYASKDRLFSDESAEINTQGVIHQLRIILNEINVAAESFKHTSKLQYIGHPINAYSLIKRWSTFLTEDHLDVCAFLLSQTELENLPIPKQFDYTGSALAILRLQRVYALLTEDLAEGIVLGRRAVHRLYADDFIAIGTVALESGFNAFALEWLIKATKAADGCTNFQPYLKLASLYNNIGDLKTGFQYAKRANELAPHEPEVMHLYDLLEFKIDRLDPGSLSLNISWVENITEETKNYERLCNGHTIASGAKNLRCFLREGPLPYIIYKEEVLSYDPKIALYHDVITENEGNSIINKAYPNLNRAAVGDTVTQTVSNIRVSKVAWLWDENDEMEKFSNRVSMITGLKTKFSLVATNSEPFQVINYGIGGQYEPHHDFLADRSKLDHSPSYLQGSGDRIATFLIYLSEVEYGGSTVFPNLNIRVPPLKYGAAFWYNFKLNGEQDMRTLHAGCPVLLGQKWATNKWIRENGQMFTRKCGLHINDTDYPDFV